MEVPPDEWQYRMVVVRKHNGSPRRTVDMQELNKATPRPTNPAVAPLLLPFRRLLKDDVPWEWTAELQQTFMASRELLAERIEEGIKIYDPYKVTMVLSDWCKHGVGYILTQKHCKCKIVNDCPDINCCRPGWKVCSAWWAQDLPPQLKLTTHLWKVSC